MTNKLEKTAKKILAPAMTAATIAGLASGCSSYQMPYETEKSHYDTAITVNNEQDNSEESKKTVYLNTEAKNGENPEKNNYSAMMKDNGVKIHFKTDKKLYHLNQKLQNLEEGRLKNYVEGGAADLNIEQVKIQGNKTDYANQEAKRNHEKLISKAYKEFLGVKEKETKYAEK